MSAMMVKVVTTFGFSPDAGCACAASGRAQSAVTRLAQRHAILRRAMDGPFAVASHLQLNLSIN
jgi:hypothetical protein